MAVRMSRRIAGVGALLLLAAGLLAGCSEKDPEPPAAATPEVQGPPRQGPAPLWSLPQAGVVAGVGDVLVVDGRKALYGVDRATGRELWKLDHGSLVRMRVASGLLVAWIAREVGSGDGRLEVLDPATGQQKWKADPVREDWLAIHQDAVYIHACRNDRTLDGCTVTSREVRTGQQRWQVPSQSYGVSKAAIGVHPPDAPAAGRYIAAKIGPRGWKQRSWMMLDKTTGKAMKARAADTAWPVLVVGTDLVVTDYSTDATGDACAVAVSVIGADGNARPARIGYFERVLTADECPHNPSGSPTGILIGAGTRIVVGTEDRRPQLLDVSTGRFGWQAKGRGVPLDTDGRSVLVRERTAEGKLTMLDFGTGRVRWTASDPGPNPGRGASRYAFVTERLVLVAGSTGDWRADTVEAQAVCLVYDVRTGRRLAVLPGRPAGAGKDWVAVNTPAGELELTRF